jgi:uncharacterized membrane protein
LDITLRLLHILFGVYWVGSDVTLTFILLPRLKALGPSIERPVMRVLMKVIPPITTISAIITIVAGILLVGRLKGWGILFSVGWGWAIFISLVLTGLAVIVGFGLLPLVAIKYEKLSQKLEAQTPNTDEGHRLDSLTRQVTIFGRLNSVLLILVAAAMAVARFV